MFIWNVLTTWWIVNASVAGAILAMVANSFIMCLPWWGYHIFKKKFSRHTAYFAFVSFWLAFEYIHLNWQLSWPWLHLGNVFANQVSWVQWYEYTGVGGGTLWVLVVNVIMYEWLLGKEEKNKKSKARKSIALTSLIIIPVLISLFINRQHSLVAAQPKMKYNVVIVQPNIDPYGKFDQTSTAQQVQTLLQLSQSAADSSTRLLIWPETALSAGVAVNEIEAKPEYQPVFHFLSQHPQITLLTGIETYKWYGEEKPESAYARKASNGGYYESYNAAITLQANQPHQFYVKSKLVPGVETLPSFLNFLAPVFQQFGGTTGGYARDTASVAFKTPGNPYTAAPIICYESTYGEYVASYVQKGANLLTIITNDGWWGNTPGHKQHLAFARLRAVETKKWVARSANTGISAIIDPYGNIMQTQPWNKAATIKSNIPVSNDQTFYVKYGDYIYKSLTLMAGFLVLWNFANLFLKRRNSSQIPGKPTQY